MEELIAAKKHFSKIGWRFVAATAVIYGLELAVSTAVRLLKPDLLDNANMALMLSIIPMYLAGFPLLILLLKKDVPAQPPERRRMTAGQYVLSAIICLGLAYAANIVGNILTTAIGILKGGAVRNDITEVALSVSPWMVLIYMVLCAPIMEEFIFRKLIVDRAVRYGQGVAVVVSGLMFGLFHGNLNQFLYAAVIGMFLAFLYVKTGNLKITISLHMMFNCIGGFVSTLLMKLIDIEGYLRLVEEGADMPRMMEHIMDNLLGWMLYLGLFIFIICMMIAGIVLLIIAAAKKKFVLEQGGADLPKGLRFNIALANSGMLVFGVFWIGMIVLQLFQ